MHSFAMEKIISLISVYAIENYVYFLVCFTSCFVNIQYYSSYAVKVQFGYSSVSVPDVISHIIRLFIKYTGCRYAVGVGAAAVEFKIYACIGYVIQLIAHGHISYILHLIQICHVVFLSAAYVMQLF